MARPRKRDAAERRTAFFGLQVTPAERAEIDRRAALSGLHGSEWGRRMLLSDERAPAPGARDLAAAINALLVEFVRQGTNVNQMSRHCNEHHEAPSHKLLAEMAAMLSAAIAKVLAL